MGTRTKKDIHRTNATNLAFIKEKLEKMQLFEAHKHIERLIKWNEDEENIK